MRLGLLLSFLLTAARAWAEVTVSAAVDQARVSFGESLTYTITISGTQSSGQPLLPRIDGLNIAGPAVNTSVSIINGQMSQSVGLAYSVTPKRTGEFVIPGVDVVISGKNYRTEPIKITVEKSGTQTELSQVLFARVQMASPQVFVGQTAPLNLLLFSRQNVPLRGLTGYNAEADGLAYQFNQQVRSGTQVINGETFNVQVIEGAISPSRAGQLQFGPGVIKAQLTQQRRNRPETIFDEVFGRVEVREVPVTIEPVSIEVLPLPTAGRPPDFAGAIGQWNVEVDAKPTDVAVGDPITLTVKITGNGNIDTVPPLQLSGLDNFKTYDPTTKTTKSELNTTGERVFQQVLIAKDTGVTQLPEVRLTYFDPVAQEYRVAGQAAIPLKVRPGATAAVLTGSSKARAAEKLGEDIVYLKGSLGPVATVPLSASPWFWVLNVLPVIGLAGLLGWKARRNRMAGDVAYARRSRAARRARQLLGEASGLAQVQRALQEYLGDRLNVPASGLTGAVAEEHGLPEKVRDFFEACDAARFAGAKADMAALKQQVEQVIEELENAPR